jgi:DNA-binding transcriptional regulator YiaG
MMAIATGNAGFPTTASRGDTSVVVLRAALITASLLWLPQQGTTATNAIEKPAVLTTAHPDGQLVSVPAETTSEAIFEIRRRSGLTWEELSDLFQVSRRSVHHWAGGKAVTAQHQQQIGRTLMAIRQLDQGEAKRTRNFLLTPGADGLLVFDLLKAGAFDEALTLSGTASPWIRPPMTELSLEVRRGRRPPRPVDLVAALGDHPANPTAARVTRTFRASKET